jgi:hypothetical protein
MNESEKRLENGLETDGRLVIECIKAGKKSGAVDYWDLIFSLDQAHENGEYERPDSFLCQYPDFADSIKAGEDYIQYTLKKARTAYTLWNRIYKAATDAKNQVGLDEMMEWGKAFASYYSEFRIALENQKNFLSCHLPALAKLKDLKAAQERAETPPTPEILSELKRLEELLMSSMSELQKANHAASIALDQKRKEMEVPISKAASIIAEEAEDLEIQKYCIRGAYTSLSANERNIKNWEAKRNPCPWPGGFPSRLQPEKDFRIYVRRRLKGYLDQIRIKRRKREEKKMRENLGVDDPDHFYGISIDNPPKRYKAIVERALIDPHIDKDWYPTFAYFDEEEEKYYDEAFYDKLYQEIDRIDKEFGIENDDEDDDDDEFDDGELDDEEFDDE